MLSTLLFLLVFPILFYLSITENSDFVIFWLFVVTIIHVGDV